ncbi:MAG: zinc ribbon domain-containing protein [Ruminococcus flavefaciens]|nr:zinc ribbon domain-containing protein [Ruminococcus flavefaciens]MCM1060633.1 zinc ribbon domain-containing protein [Eubacterium sp.]
MGFLDSVKGFAGKVGDTVEKGAKSVSESSKKMTEKSRVKKEITQLENEINNAYYAIGKKYFELNSADPADEYAAPVNDIIQKSERAEKFRLLLASMEDKQPCSNCGAEVMKGQRFCDKCGAQVEFVAPPIIEGFNDAPVVPEPVPVQTVESVVEPAPSAPTKKVCSNCGASFDEGQNFCDKCGTKL